MCTLKKIIINCWKQIKNSFVEEYSHSVQTYQPETWKQKILIYFEKKSERRVVLEVVVEE